MVLVFRVAASAGSKERLCEETQEESGARPKNSSLVSRAGPLRKKLRKAPGMALGNLAG
jgi:hypothetical protein